MPRYEKGSGNNRIIEYPGLDGTHKNHGVQLLALQTSQNPTLWLRAVFKPSWSSGRFGAVPIP